MKCKNIPVVDREIIFPPEIFEKLMQTALRIIDSVEDNLVTTNETLIDWIGEVQDHDEYWIMFDVDKYEYGPIPFRNRELTYKSCMFSVSFDSIDDLVSVSCAKCFEHDYSVDEVIAYVTSQLQ